MQEHGPLIPRFTVTSPWAITIDGEQTNVAGALAVAQPFPPDAASRHHPSGLLSEPFASGSPRHALTCLSRCFHLHRMQYRSCGNRARTGHKTGSILRVLANFGYVSPMRGMLLFRRGPSNIPACKNKGPTEHPNQCSFSKPSQQIVQAVPHHPNRPALSGSTEPVPGHLARAGP